ncbi:MAG: c-type cytochrome, partial [Rhizobiales bacterium]|nr:c-type cytochrome [Hyphomicrobiales bacterium]
MRKSAPLLIAGSALLGSAQAGQTNDFSQIERGRYLTQAGNCQGCHTPPGDEPFAGSRALETPFGLIYTPNITFDTETGLGRWTKDDFWRAMHEGKAKDGSQLYPAFPYPHFTKMPREDVDAIYDYLATLDPVRKKKPENELPFPLSWRTTVKGWNMTFFEPGVFRPDLSARWMAYSFGGQVMSAWYLVEDGYAGEREVPRLIREAILMACSIR